MIESQVDPNGPPIEQVEEREGQHCLEIISSVVSLIVLISRIEEARRRQSEGRIKTDTTETNSNGNWFVNGCFKLWRQNASRGLHC